MTYFSVTIVVFLIVVGVKGLDQQGDGSIFSNYLNLYHMISEERADRLVKQEEIETRLQELQDENRVLEAKLNNLTGVQCATNNRQIAFSGRLSKKMPKSDFGKVVKFDEVTTNIGNAYNTTSGIFRCPVAGLYLFSGSILGDKVSFVIIEILHNGASIARPHSGFGANGHESGSDTTVVHADAGDEIYSQVTGGGAAYLDHFSRFTAVLLKAD